MINVKRGEFMVWGVKADHTEGPIDVLDLDEESWRRFVMGKLMEVRCVFDRYPEAGDYRGGHPMRERSLPQEPIQKPKEKRHAAND